MLPHILLPSSSSGWGRALEFSGVQSAIIETVLLQQDVESQSLTRSKADQHKLARLPTRSAQFSLFPSLVSASRAMCDLIGAIRCARDSQAPMLITGEPGTGKELLSRVAHALSSRRKWEFIAFNCAAANRELIESQLFGHQRGSFTGATCDSKGVIREANGGTLLLDEIGELSLDLQPKLLRFLQDGETQPVGAGKPVRTNVRVIAATNRDLEADVRSGRFRADLYERLNVLRFHIPPLRKRREDILPLTEYFFDHYQRQELKHGLRLSREAAKQLLDYDWPRNVRQLENEAYRLVLYARNNEVIGPERLSPEIRARDFAPKTPQVEIVAGRLMLDLSMPYHEARDEMERQYIINALMQTGGNQQRAAERVKMSRAGFRKAINRLGVDVQKYR